MRTSNWYIVTYCRLGNPVTSSWQGAYILTSNISTKVWTVWLPERSEPRSTLRSYLASFPKQSGCSLVKKSPDREGTTRNFLTILFALLRGAIGTSVRLLEESRC